MLSSALFALDINFANKVQVPGEFLHLTAVSVVAILIPSLISSSMTMIPLDLVSGVQSLSSGVQSTPEKRLLDDASESPELLKDSLKTGPEKDLLQTCLGKDKKQSAVSMYKMPEQVSQATKRTLKNQELKKPLLAPNGQPSRKQSRKAGNPSRFPVITEQCAGLKCLNSLVCQNSACRATLSIDDAFCKRCSCCICHSFDDNKDPSLWLECMSDFGVGDSCGLSCHIECALQRRKVGVVNLGQLMQLDGSYCCASCGKVSGILSCWRKQLLIAKEARRVDVLSFRINMSYRLLDGTSRFKELHDIVTVIKLKLDTELGPLTDVSTKMARGIVSRLSVAGDVQTLCSIAIEKADEWLAATSGANPNCREGSLPAACKVLFEDISFSSVVILLVEASTSPLKDIKGYKLWYCRTREDTHSEEPACVFPRSQRRVLISNLLPCTEYSFRIVSYTDAGEMGHTEAKCFTKSVEIIRKNSRPVAVNNRKETIQVVANMYAGTECKTAAEVESDSGFQVHCLGKILQIAASQEKGCLNEMYGARTQNCSGVDEEPSPPFVQDQLKPGSRELDLNVASVPDLNEELSPPVDSSRDDNNVCTGRVGADDYEISHDNHKNDVEKSHGSGDSQNLNHKFNGDLSAVHLKGKMYLKRAATKDEESHDSDSTLINRSSGIRDNSRSLGQNFEDSVKIIRWLECKGYIKRDFRLKLLTWYSLRSTEQERRVVNTFIQTLIDDPSSLAGQLLDSFSDVVSSKKPRNGFCSIMWH